MIDLTRSSDDDLHRLIKSVQIKNTRVHFARNCHRNTKGDRLEFDRFRHMVELYNSVSPHIVIVGAAQVGKTDWLIVDTLAAAYNNLSVFFVLPKHDHMTTYSKEKVQKALSLSPEYKALNKNPVSEAIALLQFGPGLIKFVGANVATDFVSFSGDQYCFDGNTPVLTTLGEIPIRDLCDYVGQKIIISSDLNGGSVVNELTSWVQLPPKQVYRYFFSNGEYVDVTDDHRIWTVEGWLPIGNVFEQRETIEVVAFNGPSEKSDLRLSFGRCLPNPLLEAEIQHPTGPVVYSRSAPSNISEPQISSVAELCPNAPEGINKQGLWEPFCKISDSDNSRVLGSIRDLLPMGEREAEENSQRELAFKNESPAGMGLFFHGRREQVGEGDKFSHRGFQLTGSGNYQRHFNQHGLLGVDSANQKVFPDYNELGIGWKFLGMDFPLCNPYFAVQTIVTEEDMDLYVLRGKNIPPFGCGRQLDYLPETQMQAENEVLAVREAIQTNSTITITGREFLGYRDVFDINVKNHHNFIARRFLIAHNCIDEIDKCESDDNIELGYSRLQGSRFRFTRVVSNPTTKEGKIWQRWLLSDQRVWVCPCSICGKFSEIDWFKCIVREVEDSQGNIVSHVLRDTEWHPGCGRDIRVKCPDENCEGNLLRFDESCHWEPMNPDSKITGYHMPSLLSPLATVEQGWAEYLAGLQNPSKMAKFYSMFLALPYAPVGSKVTTNLLGNCVGRESQYTVRCMPDHACLPEDTHPGPCSMGIDTSPNHIDIRISSNEKGRRKLIYVGKLDISGKPIQAIEENLHILAERFNAGCAVIDIGPEKILAQAFQSNAKFPVWLCKFLGRGEERLLKYNYSDMIISVDRTEALDRAYSQLKTGRNLLPVNYKSIMQGSYVAEMTSLVREVNEDKQGKIRYSWTSGNDHAFLADAYDIMAWDIIQDDVLTGEQCVFVG